jgi:hypothetical protein
MASAMTSYDDSEEAPLDPAALRLRRKMVRLLIVSGGIMVLGFIAVFAAIIYKLNEGASGLGSGSAPIAGAISIPSGHRIVGTALDGDRALLTLAAPDGSTTLLVVDLASGRTLASYAVNPAD